MIWRKRRKLRTIILALELERVRNVVDAAATRIRDYSNAAVAIDGQPSDAPYVALGMIEAEISWLVREAHRNRIADGSAKVVFATPSQNGGHE